MKLHNFFRSGTSHRLRIALQLKGLAYEYVPVDLRTEQHQGAAFKALNPQGLVPALEVDGQVLIQSPAIIEWLEETHPTPPLLPADPAARARVRALAALVGACDGDLGVGVLSDASAQLLEVDADALRADLLPRVRELLVTGFLEFADD